MIQIWHDNEHIGNHDGTIHSAIAHVVGLGDGVYHLHGHGPGLVVVRVTGTRYVASYFDAMGNHRSTIKG